MKKESGGSYSRQTHELMDMLFGCHTGSMSRHCPHFKSDTYYFLTSTQQEIMLWGHGAMGTNLDIPTKWE